MKIKFLGTAAAEAIPGVFCECETCRRSRTEGGKNIRTRSQAIVDDKILLDFPADTYFHSIMHGIELSKIETCLVTHSHSDHLYPDELWARSVGIANGENLKPITFYAAQNGYQKIMNTIIAHGLDDTDRVRAKKIFAFEPFEAESYTVTPLKARHASDSSPVIYIIAKDGKSMLYAHDTGYFPDETVEYIKNSKIKLDFVSIDCCGGLAPGAESGYYSHLNLPGAVKMCNILKENGNITDNTVCVVNHFSHNGASLHNEMAAAAEKEGFIAAYDGLEIEF